MYYERVVEQKCAKSAQKPAAALDQRARASVLMFLVARDARLITQALYRRLDHASSIRTNDLARCISMRTL